MSQTQLPASWTSDDNDSLVGLDLTDKQQLVDEPFRILGVQFRFTNQNAHMVVVDVEKVDGNQLSFQDASGTGVRQEIIEYLTEKKLDAAIDSGDYITFPRPLVIPRGLRVSEYDAPAGSRAGAPKRKTYYLTKMGRTRPEAAPAAPTRTRKAATPAS